MIKKIFSLLFLVGSIATNSFGQLVLSDADYDALNPLDCAGIDNGGSPNFTDGAGNYTPGMNDTIVLCPDLNQGSKVSISFATNIGYTWNVDGTDTLYIYDGSNTSAPLIGAFNSITDPLSFFVQASWANVSGCLTLVFVSDGAIEGTGWEANVSCGNPFQPFEPHIEAYINGLGADALNPLDTGYVDVCFGDSILFISTPEFPNSFETNGFGYSQTVENCAFNWTIGGVGQFTNDSVWFTPPQRMGYYVDLRVTDIFPLNARTTCKVRVSQLPLFTGTGPVEDTVCLGQNTNLVGGVTATDTVGIDIPNGELTAGGTFAGLTFLPDGNGLQSQTSIAFAGFDNNATVSGPGDMVQVCMDIEHSYLGDLEISLECPNGTIVSLVNANDLGIGMTPGGCGSGIGTFLGNDTNIDGGAPGAPSWTYCFSEVNATLGTMCAENANSYWINNDYGFQAMNPAGVYLPDEPWSGFNGCPLNGPWTIIVQDNQGIDDGYIFEWSIEFNSALYPTPESYQNYVVFEDWAADSTIISGQNDTLLVIQPDTPGDYGYTYNITDDFGCDYDTTVFLYVLPQPVIQNDTIGCNLGVFLQGTESYNGGVWSSADTSINFDPNQFAENPQVYTSTPGTYEITYTDNACSTPVTMEVTFPPYVWAALSDTVLCYGVEYELDPAHEASATTWDWNTGSSDSMIVVTEPGVYTVTASNICHSGTASAIIDYKLCDIIAPNIVSLSSAVGNDIWFVQSEGIQSFECHIVNRWGNNIYSFDSTTGGWNGRDNNGNIVSEGTYYYIINAVLEGGEPLTKQGFIQVVH
jgi:subtilisin-like proprotein convertase family protein